jgi:hypothetical protein
VVDLDAVVGLNAVMPRGARLRRLAAVGLVALCATACSFSTLPVADEATVTSILESHFALLDEQGIDVYWNALDCHLIASDRGTFSREVDEPRCWVDGFGSGSAMDDRAAEDFRTVGDAMSASGLDVEYISVERQDGTVGPGTFFVFNACSTYSFHGDGTLEAEYGALESIAPIGGGWYVVLSC